MRLEVNVTSKYFTQQDEPKKDELKTSEQKRSTLNEIFEVQIGRAHV